MTPPAASPAASRLVEIGMRGMVSVKVGDYRLSEHVSLTVQASDAGTLIGIYDQWHGRRYAAIVDESGEVVWNGFQQRPVPEAQSPSRPETVQNAPVPSPTPEPSLPPRHLTDYSAMSITFKIDKRVKYRQPEEAYVMGGYTDGEHVHVLYRILEGEDGLLRRVGNEVLLGRRVPPRDRLPDEAWDYFLSLRARTVFMIGSREHRKMTFDQLRAAVGGRTFKTAARPPKPS